MLHSLLLCVTGENPLRLDDGYTELECLLVFDARTGDYATSDRCGDGSCGGVVQTVNLDLVALEP